MRRAFVANGGMRDGKTTDLLLPFVKGMEDAGCEVDLCYIKQVRIKPCIGDFRCWYKTPGKCHIKDEMQELYDRVSEADVLVLASPVYAPIPGEMQNFINRLVPLIDPILRSKDGRTMARTREGVRWKSITVVSTCGWWGLENFDSFVKIARDLAFKTGVGFAGSVLRPHSFVLNTMEQKRNEIHEAARKAGSELVIEGKISEGSGDIIAQPLVTEEELRLMY